MDLYLDFSSIYFFPYIYIYLIITFICVLLTLQYEKTESLIFLLFILLINYAAINLFITNSLIFFFFYYEMLLIPSFYILYKFAKTRRAIEASYLMFFWTQFGAIFLIFSFIYIYLITKCDNIDILLSYNFNTFDVNILTLFLVIGFGVKFPIWPFYGWLPRAHVEAPTNFSIFLSGVLVKFAFFGLIKFLLIIKLEPSLLFLIPVLSIGSVEASIKLVYQIDIKKIIAFSTVIEMHWLALSIISGFSNLFLASYCMLISHAFLSTNFFLIIDCVMKRFKSRLIIETNSIGILNKNLFLLILINLLLFLGFPGSLFFLSEVLFFSFLLDSYPITLPLFLFILYLFSPTIYFTKWWSIVSGNSINLKTNLKLDLNKQELVIISFNSTLLIILGLFWQVFLFNSYHISKK